jgi:hypothetical protein
MLLITGHTELTDIFWSRRINELLTMSLRVSISSNLNKELERD